MGTGAITSYVDVAQITLYVFWIFFAVLILYLHREGKREGYPLEFDRSATGVRVVGFPDLPPPKTFLLRDGSSVSVPRAEPPAPAIRAKSDTEWNGMPLVPTGNPMLDAVGPASYTQRADVPALTADDQTMLAPMRVATDYHVEKRDPDPRGMNAVGADGKVGGVIVDLWVDRAEPQIRYMEIETKAAGGPRRVLVPATLTRVNAGKRQVVVQSIMGAQFADAPGLQNPNQVTLREEDRISAYYGGGTLYAHPSRQEPLI